MRETFLRYQLLWLLGWLSIGGCASIPSWEGKIFAGDSAKGGISRNNPPEPAQFIAASSPLFDQYLAMSYTDFKSFYATYVLGCKSWGLAEKDLQPPEVVLKKALGDTFSKLMEQEK